VLLKMTPQVNIDLPVIGDSVGYDFLVTVLRDFDSEPSSKFVHAV
jgi:hypothetical protein